MDPQLPQRVFNADGDGLGGLTIDRYQDYYVFTWYAQGVYQQREMIYAAFEAATEHQFKGIYAKLRFNVEEANLKSQLVTGEAAPEPLLVTEGAVTYPLHLADDLTTGLLLDMRPIREWLAGAELQGKTVLNLFSQKMGLRLLLPLRVLPRRFPLKQVRRVPKRPLINWRSIILTLISRKFEQSK